MNINKLCFKTICFINILIVLCSCGNSENAQIRLKEKMEKDSLERVAFVKDSIVDSKTITAYMKRKIHEYNWRNDISATKGKAQIENDFKNANCQELFHNFSVEYREAMASATDKDGNKGYLCRFEPSSKKYNLTISGEIICFVEESKVEKLMIGDNYTINCKDKGKYIGKEGYLHHSFPGITIYPTIGDTVIEIGSWLLGTCDIR